LKAVVVEETLRNQKLSSWNIGHDLFHQPSSGDCKRIRKL